MRTGPGHGLPGGLPGRVELAPVVFHHVVSVSHAGESLAGREALTHLLVEVTTLPPQLLINQDRPVHPLDHDYERATIGRGQVEMRCLQTLRSFIEPAPEDS